MPSLTANRTTAAAQAWLVAAQPARVLNAFDHACNLVSDSGQVLALVSAARGLTPCGLVVESASLQPFAAVAADSPVSLSPGLLHIGLLTIDYSAAVLWDARPDWLALQAGLAAAPDCLDLLAALAADLAPAGSLLELFATPARPTLSPALLARARPAATDLVTGLAAGDWEQAEAGALRLAGLGGGLTPAGDDFALGVFLAAHAGLYGPAAAAHCAALAFTMLPRTTTLSAAYLQAAARGECASYWHAVLVALIDPSPDLPAAVKALVSVGHTSGADGLAGLVALHLLRTMPLGMSL